MALTKPIMSLGLNTYNAAMSVPVGDLSGLPSGWTGSGSSVTPSTQETTGRDGHDRVQYFTISAATTYTLVGSPCSPYMLTANAATEMLGVLVAGISGAAAANTSVAIAVRYYRSNGTTISTSVNILTLTGARSLSLCYGTGTITPPGLTFAVAVVVSLIRTGAGSSVVSLAFANIGCWDSTNAAYWQWARHPGSPGTSARKTAQVETHRQLYGPAVAIDRTRYAKPYRVQFSLANWTNSEKQSLERAWSYNCGRSVELSNGLTNPAGGV